MKYDIISTRIRKTIKIRKPDDLHQFIKRYAKSRQEHFLVITMDGQHQIIGIHISTIGTAQKVVIHPREVFIHAIRDNATTIMVAHNHPSGGIKPSKEDIEITEKLNSAAEILGFFFLDHLIFTKKEFYSFRQNGKLSSIF
jgi:DNA repair protein RadC